MVYFMRHCVPAHGQWAMLCEGRTVPLNTHQYRYVGVPAARAHALVKAGATHETALWWDGKRIRRAGA